MWFWMSDCILFVACIFNINGSSVMIPLFSFLHGWWHVKTLSRRKFCVNEWSKEKNYTAHNNIPHKTLRVHSILPYTSLQCHMGRVYGCLADSCYLHFWRNGRHILRATAVTRGWNEYRNKSQHGKLTLEKKILPPLMQGLEPGSFRSWVRRANHWAIPAPHNKHLPSSMALHVHKNSMAY